MMPDIKRIEEVVERLRSEKLPNLPKDLVMDIIQIEARSLDQESRIKRIDELIRRYLNTLEEGS